jgi:hypothetical protein
MRYLKQFNENNTLNAKEFCTMHLANLLDNGFNNYNIIKWDSIKDEFIPFLHILSNKYNIESLPYYKDNVSSYRYIDDNPINRTIRFNPDNNYYYYSNIEDIINDKDAPSEFYQIQITFKQRH